MSDFEKIELNTAETGPDAPEETPPESPEVAPETAEERPEWLDDKFKTPEDMAKSYHELEKKLSTEKPPPVAEGKIDFNALQAEYIDTGEFSEESYVALEKLGFDRQAVDQWQAGQDALATNARTDLASVAGGEEGLAAVIKWAEEGISEQAKVSFNNAVEGNDIAGAKLALQGIVALYNQAEGVEPTLVQGVAMPSMAGAKPFRSIGEQNAAIQNPKYKTDSAYRDDVMKRIAASDL